MVTRQRALPARLAIHRVAQAGVLRLLHQGVDDEGLMTRGQFLLDATEERAPFLGAHHQGLDGLPARRPALDDRHVELPIERLRQRARDRRRRHHERMGREPRAFLLGAAGQERPALLHAEAMLLVHHDES